MSADEFMPTIGQRAVDKLQDAEAALTEMRRARSPLAVTRAFDTCTAAVQAAWYHLKTDALKTARTPGMKRHRADCEQWFRDLKDRVKDDELLNWAELARHYQTHGTGQPALAFRAVGQFNTDDFEPSPAPGASFAWGARGAEWILQMGTAYERTFPAYIRPDSPSAARLNGFFVQPRTPPRAHLGQPVTTTDPVELCRMVIAAWRDIVHDASTRWAT